jgi:hypothetical protein
MRERRLLLMKEPRGYPGDIVAADADILELSVSKAGELVLGAIHLPALHRPQEELRHGDSRCSGGVAVIVDETSMFHCGHVVAPDLLDEPQGGAPLMDAGTSEPGMRSSGTGLEGLMSMI